MAALTITVVVDFVFLLHLKFLMTLTTARGSVS